MISLKKYLEMDGTERPDEISIRRLLAVCLEGYRSVMQSVGENANRVCPAFGGELNRGMLELAGRLSDEATPESVAEISKNADAQLESWGERGAQYLNTKTAEIKELLIVLARTAASVGEKDQHYASQFNQFTTNLRAISNLEDLTQIRASLVQQANELKNYVDRMEQDSDRLVQQLRSEVNTYEEKLKKVEELAVRDPLTGLANRRNLEERIGARILRNTRFCVVMLDLNRLKLVNDRYGHPAGDSLLKQFAQELRSAIRASDDVGRWGGDEFLLVIDGDEDAAKVQVERLRRWIFGKYTVPWNAGAAEVELDASVGVAQWREGETLASVVQRADAAMYEQKKSAVATRG